MKQNALIIKRGFKRAAGSCPFLDFINFLNRRALYKDIKKNEWWFDDNPVSLDSDTLLSKNNDVNVYLLLLLILYLNIIIVKY